jgi:hypothetical protein
MWYLFADPLCKKLSDRKGGQGSRLLASTGILMVAGGIATTTLLHKSRLQVLSYGFLGGKNNVYNEWHAINICNVYLGSHKLWNIITFPSRNIAILVSVGQNLEQVSKFLMT